MPLRCFCYVTNMAFVVHPSCVDRTLQFLRLFASLAHVQTPATLTRFRSHQTHITFHDNSFDPDILVAEAPARDTTCLSGAKAVDTNADGSDLGFIFSLKDILDTQAAPGIKLPD